MNVVTKLPTRSHVPETDRPVHSVPADDLVAAGKRLRDTVPRASQGMWKRPKDRPDPLALLRASDAGRMPELIPIRYGRMLQTPFTFFRGAANVMAADLASAPATGIHVQACGDCHLLNFGGFATPERNIVFDINDFDETLPAPWEWDVKRLVASFVLAARANGLSDGAGRDAAVAAARSYRERLREVAEMSPLEAWYASIGAEDFFGLIDDPEVKKRAQRRIEKAKDDRASDADYPKLAEMVGGQVHIKDQPPLIFHMDVQREAGFRDFAEKALADYRETLPDDRRALLDRYRLVDVAIKVVGIGSVGRYCAIGLFMSSSNQPLFLQFKQAVPSVLEPYAGKSVYEHSGQRVVMGQRLMQSSSDIFLGWVTAPGRPPGLCAPVARRQDQAAGRDVRPRHAGDLWQGLRLGAGARAWQGGPSVADQRLSWHQRCLRRGDGEFRGRLCRPGRARPRRPEGGRQRRQDQGPSWRKTGSRFLDVVEPPDWTAPIPARRTRKCSPSSLCWVVSLLGIGRISRSFSAAR